MAITLNLTDCQGSLLPNAIRRPMAEAQGVHALISAREPGIQCNKKGQIYANTLALSELFCCRETRHLIGCELQTDPTKPQRGIKLPALQIAWGASDWRPLGRDDERRLKSVIHDLGFGPFRMGRLRGAMAIYATDKQSGTDQIMTVPLAPALGDARTRAMRDLAAVLAAPGAIERVGFEVWDRVRPVAGSCLRVATRLIRYAGHTGAVPLDEAQRQRAVACIKRTGWAALTDADIDHCLRCATVREVARAKSNRKGAAK